MTVIYCVIVNNIKYFLIVILLAIYITGGFICSLKSASISITNESATGITVFKSTHIHPWTIHYCLCRSMSLLPHVMSSVLMVKVNLSLSSKVSKGMRTFKPIQNEYDSVKEARGKNVTLTHKFRWSCSSTHTCTFLHLILQS